MFTQEEGGPSLPLSPSTTASWSLFACRLAGCVGRVYEAPAPALPSSGSLAQEALSSGQALATEPILLGSQPEEGSNMGTADTQVPSDLGSFGQNNPG